VAKSSAEVRRERLAAALRANLKRRKPANKAKLGSSSPAVEQMGCGETLAVSKSEPPPKARA
jgi:hypothetical protein